MNKIQRTIKAPVSVSGVGLHTGNQTNLSVKSTAGVKLELVIYYTAPEVKK